MFKNYLKTAWRNLLRNKSYAAICISSIAIGVICFWMMGLYIADEYSFDRGMPGADKVYRVVQHARWDGGSIDIAVTSPPFAPALKSKFPEVESATRIDLEGGGVVQYGEKKIKANDIYFADEGFFKVFKYDFLYGDASALAKPQSIVLTRAFAIKLFGDAGKAINKTVYFSNNYGNIVTGILMDLPGNSHLKFSAIRSTDASAYSGQWQNSYLYTYIKLAPAADPQSLKNKLPQLAKETIQKEMKVDDYKMELQPLTSIHLHSNLDYELSPNSSLSRVYIFIAIAVLILIIAIINYMNLSTARSTSRLKEVGVHRVIGSGRGNLIKMFITESILTTFIACVIASVVVFALLPFFNDIAGKHLTMDHFGIGKTIFALVIFLLITGTLSGSYPAWYLSRVKTIPALKGQPGNVGGNILFRKSLIVFQFSVTVVMITASFIIYRQMQYTANKGLGFNKEQTLTFHIDNRKVRDQIATLKTQLLKSTLVEGVAAAGNPIGNNDLGGGSYSFEQNGAISTNAQKAQQLMIDEDFLKTMDISLTAGRNFSETIPTDKDQSVLINETLMHILGWKDAIGKRMQFTKDGGALTITRKVVGVVKDFHTYSLQHKIEPLVLLMPGSSGDKDNVYIKIARGKAVPALAHIREVYARFDKSNTAEFHFLNENFEKQYEAEQKQGRLSMIFTLLAICIASLGLFGLATFTARQRIKEIGIRKVLGASVASVTFMLSIDFVKLVCISVCIAIPVAWFAMNKWLEDFAYRVSMDWWIFLGAAIMALVIALITVSFQAVKAAIANPVKSLRME